MKIQWHKIKNFLYKYRWALVLGVVLVGVLGMMGAGHAWSFPSAESIAKAIFAVLLSLVVIVLYYVFLIPIFWLTSIAIWVLVEVASFQYFINVPAVINGWTIMRDLVNMGLIVFLLYLAFATLLSLSSVNLEKDLIKLVLAVVLVNFSRMIVGLFIDVSQIIMLTFVNGFRNVAGGNIINGLRLKSFFGGINVTSDLKVAAGNFIKTTLGIIMGLLILSTIAMFVAYLIIRVVKLWLLTIMSPLMVLGQFTNKLNDFTGTWKKEFQECLMSGPFMAFYLWFSLTVIATTGDKAALTTPSGTMADNLGTQANMNTADVSNNIFTMIVGAALLWASFDMAKKMSGQAGKVGEKVWQTGKGAVIGGMKMIGKTTAKTLDKGLQLGTVAATGRDLSIGGTIKRAKESWKGIKAYADDKEKEIMTGGLLRRQKRQEAKLMAKGDYKGAAAVRDVLRKEAESLGVSLEAEEKKQASYERNVDNAEAKKNRFLALNQGKKNSLNTVLAAMTGNEGERLDYTQTVSAIDNLVKTNVMSEAEAGEIKKDFLNTDGKAVYSKAGTEDETNLKSILSENVTDIDSALALEQALESKDEGKISSILQKQEVMTEMGIDETERDALIDKYTGKDKLRLSAIDVGRTKKGDLDKEVKGLDAELRQMVQSKILSDQKSAGHRVVLNHMVESKKKVRQFFEQKYNGIDNPDEIASFLRTGVSAEERNFLLEKAGDDVSQVLEKAGYERDLGGLKALFAKGLDAPKGELEGIGKVDKDRFVQAREALKAGKATEEDDLIVTTALNQQLRRNDWDTVDVVDKKSRTGNAALSYGVSMDPHGLHTFKTGKAHYKDVERSYKRGGVSARALTPLLTYKKEDGTEHLTDLGKSFLITHNRELGKDAFSDEFGKGVLDAIRNDMEDVQLYLEAVQASGLVSGDLFTDDYNEKDPSSNPLKHIQRNIQIAATKIAASKQDQLIGLGKKTRAELEKEVKSKNK